MAYIFNGFWFVTLVAVHKPHLVYGPIYSLLNPTIQLLHVGLCCQLLFPACQWYVLLLKLFISLFFKKIPSACGYPDSVLHMIPVQGECHADSVQLAEFHDIGQFAVHLFWGCSEADFLFSMVVINITHKVTLRKCQSIKVSPID